MRRKGHAASYDRGRTAIPYWSGPGTKIRSLRPPFEIPPIVLRQHWHRRFQNDARNKWKRTNGATRRLARALLLKLALEQLAQSWACLLQVPEGS